MGAVPGGSVLSLRAGGLADWFDVDPFRTSGRRVVVRTVDRPVLVLGSTQDDALVDRRRLRSAGVELARRRSGGGAVLLEPGAQSWVDLWVPRGDRLWSDEPRRSAARVGEWWAGSLSASLGARIATVHRGPNVPGPAGGLVCFSGIAPGEVLVDGRKLVGLAQWRSRQGALVHGCVYRSWDPARISWLLAPSGHGQLGASLATAAVGLEDLGAGEWTVERLVATLPEPGSWQVVHP